MVKQSFAVFLGPPGAGKGTLAAALVKKYGCLHVATGDVFRRHVRDKTPLGERVASLMRAGEYVPDALTNAVVKEELDAIRARGPRGWVLLDGYPRTEDQARYLDTLVSVEAAILLTVPDPETIVARLAGRRVCPTCAAVYHVSAKPPRRPDACDADGSPLATRKDDAPEVVRARLETYAQTAAPVSSFYEKKGVLLRLDASAPTQDLVARVEPVFGAKA